MNVKSTMDSVAERGKETIGSGHVEEGTGPKAGEYS